MQQLHEYTTALNCAHELASLAATSRSKVLEIFCKHYRVTALSSEEAETLRRNLAEFNLICEVAISLGAGGGTIFQLAEFIFKAAADIAQWRAASDPLDKFLKERH